MQKTIIKKFNFLEKQGFKRKVYFRNGDSEIYYTKNKLTIEIHYYLSTMMQYCLEVIVNYNGERANIFNCDFFDEVEISLLQNQIDSIEEPNSYQKKLDVFVGFVEKHINDLYEYPSFY